MLIIKQVPNFNYDFKTCTDHTAIDYVSLKTYTRIVVYTYI